MRFMGTLALCVCEVKEEAQKNQRFSWIPPTIVNIGNFTCNSRQDKATYVHILF